MTTTRDSGPMWAVEIASFGGPEVLRPVTRSIPQPAAGELLIRVHAAGVARADTMQRQGKYPPPAGASDIPGLDVAGTIASPDPSGRFQIGDRVCAILTGGGYAEYCVAPVEQVLPTPAGWEDAEAATLPENIFTAFDNLITRPALVKGETVLIHGGTSGVGSMAIMLGRAWDATVIATAGSSRKCEDCRLLGANFAIDYRAQDFVAEVKALTGGNGANVVLDMVGGSYLDRNLQVLATEGRLSLIATQGGSKSELDLGTLMRKRARVMGSTMRTRTAAQKGEVAARLFEEVWPLLPGKSVIRPLIDSTFPLRHAAEAHARMESGEHIGKIVLLA